MLDLKIYFSQRWSRKKFNICVARNFSEFHVRLSTLHSSKSRKPWS